MQQFVEFISQPWPWYVAGPMIGLTVPALLLIGNKSFGISSSLRHICASCVPSKIPFFQYNWKREAWNLMFVLGILLGGILAVNLLDNGQAINISEATKQDLASLGISNFDHLMPAEIFGLEQLNWSKGLIFLVLGGFLVGFGTRYGGGCTSGHAIMGLSNLQWPSLVATCCFMAGGFIMTHLFLPTIIGWIF